MYCLIVKRGDFARYDRLYKTFNEHAAVIWERRRMDRRKTSNPMNGHERRRAERRGPAPLTWTALGFAVAKYDR